MNKSIALTQSYFESSSNRTPKYTAWHRLFKKEFTALLRKIGASAIIISKPNHFNMSGFFLIGNQWWYFSISDIRWSKDAMLLRKADGPGDYIGGNNERVSMMIDGHNFIHQFTAIIA